MSGHKHALSRCLHPALTSKVILYRRYCISTAQVLSFQLLAHICRVKKLIKELHVRYSVCINKNLAPIQNIDKFLNDKDLFFGGKTSVLVYLHNLFYIFRLFILLYEIKS